MSSSIPLRKEETIKNKKSKVVSILQFAQYFMYISILCTLIFMLLFLQFGREIKSLRRILRNSQKFRRIYPIMFPQSIKDRIISSTTQVVFTESRLAERPICVKVWQRQRIKKETTKHILYLLEGFVYNQRFAPGVYLGIMYIERLSADAQTFLPGHLTLVPHKSKLTNGEYAYVMKTLPLAWRLDYRLYSKEMPLATIGGMKFLAREVARLHRRAKVPFSKRGLPASIVDKLNFNRRFFIQSLHKLSLDGIDISAYQCIDAIMQSAVFYLEPDFKRRFDQGHIKRCHGDLKLTNLWIRPISRTFPQGRLLALDCIDFNLDFSHIDTLSDIAMLVMDLQMHVSSEQKPLVKEFVSTYLHEMAEDEKNVEAVLKYYITEKAMVCANVSILLDNASERGMEYLSLALQQASELHELLPFQHVQTIDVGKEAIAESADPITIH